MDEMNVINLFAQLTGRFFDVRERLLAGVSVIDGAIGTLGLATMFVCLCRMSQLTPHHRVLPRVSYVALFTGGFCLAAAPWLFGDTYVRAGALLFALAVLAHLLVQGLDWTHGQPPRNLESGPAPLPPSETEP